MSRLTKLLGIVAALLLTVPAQANETLTYDANGNVQSRSLPGGTTQYGYDDLDRLTSEAGPAKTQNLTYDANDNRLSDGAGSKTYTASTNKLATANGQTVTLDQVGNITQIRGLSLDWNQSGQLKSVTQGRTQLATYFYDYKGRRSRKVTPTETTIYIYDLWDHLLGEFNGTGAPLRTYIWRDDIPVAIILHGTPEKVLYLETDHLNTPIAARDENAKLVWKWESDAFGSTLPNEDPDADGVKTTINLRFPGQFYDKESGFHYNHHRYYDPLTGRYLSPDPIGLVGGRNSYGYVGGNPMSRIDPAGTSWSNVSGMFGQWLTGSGPTGSAFGPGSSEVQEMQSAPGVQSALNLYNTKNQGQCNCTEAKPVTNFAASFGLTGLFTAGTNATQQFVGSYSVDIFPLPDCKKLVVLKNTTSFKSFFYGLGPNWSRDLFGPMGNMSQVYWWIE